MRRAIPIAAILVALLLGPSPVAARRAPVPPGPVPADVDLTLELLDQTFDLAPDGTIRLTYRVAGEFGDLTEFAPRRAAPSVDSATSDSPTTDPTATDPGTTIEDEAIPSGPVLTARVLNYQALDDPDALSGLVGADPPPNRLPPVIDGVDITGLQPSITVESPTEATLELSVPTDTGISVSDRLEFNDDGIHPIVVELRVNDEILARHGTVVERRSDAAPPPVDLALFGAIDDPGPTGSGAEYEQASARFAGLVDDTDALDTGLTLAIPPSVVTASTDSGAVDGDDPDLLTDDVILAAPATPFDVSSAVAVGRVDAFVRQLIAGENQVAAAIGQTPVRAIWPTTDELSAPAAQALRDLGVRYLAMPPDVYRSTISSASDGSIPAIDRFIDVPLPDGAMMPILVLDDELGAALTEGATAAILDTMAPTEWAVETVADLRLGQYTAPPDERQDERSHLIAVPDLGAFDPRLAAELERFATTTQAVRFARASDLTSTTSTVRTDTDPRLPDVAGPSLDARLQRVIEVTQQLATVASMLPPGDPRPGIWTDRLDSFVSTALDDATVDAELDELRAEAQAIRNGVVAPDPFTFTLTGREGTIDIRVGNELSEPVDVVVRLSSPRLNFPEGDVEVRLAPEDTTVVEIPVEARSNGTSPVTVEILTPSLDPLTEPVTLTSRFTALTGLGQVLTAGLLLILLTWWFSHWRVRRRAASTAPATPEPVDVE